MHLRFLLALAIIRINTLLLNTVLFICSTYFCV